MLSIFSALMLSSDTITCKNPNPIRVSVVSGKMYRCLECWSTTKQLIFLYNIIQTWLGKWLHGYIWLVCCAAQDLLALLYSATKWRAWGWHYSFTSHTTLKVLSSGCSLLLVPQGYCCVFLVSGGHFIFSNSRLDSWVQFFTTAIVWRDRNIPSMCQTEFGPDWEVEAFGDCALTPNVCAKCFSFLSFNRLGICIANSLQAERKRNGNYFRC